MPLLIMDKAYRFLILLFLASALFLPVRRTDSVESAPARSEAFTAEVQSPDPESAAQLSALIESGRMEELRWPDCSSYRNQVKQFYLASGNAVAWTQQGRPTAHARALIDLFRAAEEKGLDPEDYDASRWPSRLESLATTNAGAEELAHFDFAVTVSALRYLSDLSQGRVNPKECRFELSPQSFNGPQFLRNEVLHSTDVKTAVSMAEPQSEGYRRTLALLQRYIALAREPDEELPAIKKPLRPGDPYSGVAPLARRLQRLGDLAPNAAPLSSDRYAQPVVDGVIHFQQRHGLKADGVIGLVTFKQIATPLSRRAVQIKLALERWRWLPRNVDSRMLVVNIPEFRLRGYDNHQMTISMRAIVGKAIGHQTPVFEDDMELLVFHPYWNVPESIQRQELVPNLRRDPDYLVRHRMELVNDHAQVISRTVNAGLLDQLASGRLKIRQQPGPANSLGLLKFLFPNKFGIYLHGTPEKSLFFQDRRDFSHGCIRIEDPAALAAWVLRDRPEWTQERIISTMSAPKQTVVALQSPIPVLIFYETVFVEEDGRASFFQDIYGHDATLEQKLSAGRR